VATLDEPAPEFEDTSEIVGVEPRLRRGRAGTPLVVVPEHRPDEPAPRPEEFVAVDRPDARPFWLRPRGRALVVVATVGIPLLLLYAAARIRADTLWFDEVGQFDVFRRMMLARVELYIAVTATVGLVVAANLLVAVRRAGFMRSRPELVGLVAASVATGTLFAAFTDPRWQTVALWRHRQSFGVLDPVFHKDIGFFVFTLPFELLVAQLLMWLVAVTAAYVAAVYWIRGWLGVRPARAAFEAQVHLAVLAASLLLVVAWRVHLEGYAVELGQPSPADAQSFAGAGFIDTHVRIPGLAAILVLVVGLAAGCVAAPFVARSGRRRPAAYLVVVPAAVLVLAVLAVGALLPALVQRYAVDPNPLPSERPYLERSIAATRHALGLDSIDIEQYTPTGSFSAADFSPTTGPFRNVVLWDPWLLEARMRELVTDTPYYHPGQPVLDAVRVGRRRRPTVVAARELDLRPIGEGAGRWINSRLAYTHGLGLIRYSGTAIDADRQPGLLDSGLGVRQPRIYFGDLTTVPAAAAAADEDSDAPTFAQAASQRSEESPWVLVDTARPEVDIPAAEGSGQTPYHYSGGGGIPLSSWIDRAVFALELGSIELLRSNDLTPSSRLLLHRDVMDRLRTLAPFVQWDSAVVPLTTNRRIVFVVDGYTTSASYPYAERVSMGGASVSYARASVRATVDSFSGRVDMYLVDPADPIARAWAEIFPTLFRPADEMPEHLRPRLRYPKDLFDAQATAYETFHATRPDVFASSADAWSRPIALSGPIEVAGDVTFDESDEDDLRLVMHPSYTYSAPPGQTRPRVLLSTYYSPRRGQNLVGTLSGWIDDLGRPHLTSRSLPRDSVILGPAQMSRLVFATPRVSNLLGLRNLEIRDLDKSSLDTVLLGTPHLLFLNGGVVQIQSLYEGSRGPGAARLIGVTAYMNGRGGLGPDIESAVRQALNLPPRVALTRPPGSIAVGRPVEIAFRVENAQSGRGTITSPAGREVRRLAVATGTGRFAWVPSVPGPVRFRVDIVGLDGTRASDSFAVRVMPRPPVIRVIQAPSRVVVGEHVRVPFQVTRALREVAEVSTREGIVFMRRYLIHDGTGVVEWTPTSAGRAVLRIRVLGLQDQRVSATVRMVVAPGRNGLQPPKLMLLEVPDVGTVGRAGTFAFRADRCREVVARIQGSDEEDVRVWRFPCPANPAQFTWTPASPGRYQFTVSAVGRDTTTEATTGFTVEPAA
jgi:uncharacterized protein